MAKREIAKSKAKKRKLKRIKDEEKKVGLEIPALRARKIRLYSSKEQEKTLKQWMGTARHTYNSAKVWYEKHPLHVRCRTPEGSAAPSASTAKARPHAACLD